MTHLPPDRLTAWVHDLLDPEEGEPVEAHVRGCAECRVRAEAVRGEARVLASALADPARLEALKKSLVKRATAAPRRIRLGALWQIPAAAAVLFALVVTLALPSPAAVELVDGRVRMEPGDREWVAPAVLPADAVREVRALEASTIRLASRFTVELEPEARIGLAPGPAADVRAGRIRFTVTGSGGPVVVRSGAGRLESAGGRFELNVIEKNEGGTKMKGMLTGVVVTVLAGSVGMSNAHGTVEAESGRVVVLAPSQAPLFVSQDDPETLLRRLEQLAAAIARLEAEISRLETRNAQLKASLKNGTAGQGRAYFGGGAGSASGWVLQSGDTNRVKTVIIEKKKEK